MPQVPDGSMCQQRIVVVVGACSELGSELVKKLSTPSQSSPYFLVLTSTSKQRLCTLASDHPMIAGRHAKVELDLLEDPEVASVELLSVVAELMKAGAVVSGVLFLAHHFRTVSMWDATSRDVGDAARFVAHATALLHRLAHCTTGRVVFVGAASGSRACEEVELPSQPHAVSRAGAFPGSLHALVKGQLREACYRLHAATQRSGAPTVIHVTAGQFGTGNGSTLSTEKVASVLLRMLENVRTPVSFNVDLFGHGMRDDHQAPKHPRQKAKGNKDKASRGDSVTEARRLWSSTPPPPRPCVQTTDRLADRAAPVHAAIETASSLAGRMREVQEALQDVLCEFECRQVARDEMERSLDVLDNLSANRQYFCSGAQSNEMTVLSLLPRNQPLYALVCFAIIPALMSTQVVVRPSSAVAAAYPRLFRLLQLSDRAPSLRLFAGSNTAFVQTFRDQANAVIVTGRPETAASLRQCFPPDVLFIANGAGHNPIVVLPGANLRRCVASIIRTTMQNQGQDCCAPCTIAVHTSMYPAVRALVLAAVAHITRHHTAAAYSDPRTLVGPNTDRGHALRTAQRLAEVADECIFGGDVNVATGMIWPTVLERPLGDGPYLTEWFAPIVSLQAFDAFSVLHTALFAHKLYGSGAMYLTLYGGPESVHRVAQMARPWHPPDTVVVNTDVHAVERGFMPYGGYGSAASHLRMGKHVVPCPTLPQRDLHWLAQYMQAARAPASSADVATQEALLRRLGEPPVSVFSDSVPPMRRLEPDDMWEEVVQSSALSLVQLPELSQS